MSSGSSFDKLTLEESYEVFDHIGASLMCDHDDDPNSDGSEWHQVYEVKEIAPRRQGLVLYGGGPEGGLHLNCKKELFRWKRTWHQPSDISERVEGEIITCKVNDDGVFIKFEPYLVVNDACKRLLKRGNALQYKKAWLGIRWHEADQLRKHHVQQYKAQGPDTYRATYGLKRPPWFPTFDEFCSDFCLFSKLRGHFVCCLLVLFPRVLMLLVTGWTWV